MSEIFGLRYADLYDIVYRAKDYVREVDAVVSFVGKHGATPAAVPLSVLDLGCGTGRHACELAARGFNVVGVDASATMLAHARERGRNCGDNAPSFIEGDIRRLDLENHDFDAALMMFAVLGYQLTNDDAVSALRAARKHLKPGGLLLFDTWYGPAVLRKGPERRVSMVGDGDNRVLRVADGHLDVASNTCTVDFDLWELFRDRPASHTAESHVVRYFFPLELDLLLSLSGFSILETVDATNPELPPDETTWNVLTISRANPA